MKNLNITDSSSSTELARTMHHAYEHHVLLSRRGLIVALGGLILSLSRASDAYAYTQYATTNMSALWNPPPRIKLSQQSNLFLPGDAPRDTAIATCSYVNREGSQNTANSYWGTDGGLSFVNNNQYYWPCRNYSYGLDIFSFEACLSGAWSSYTIDSLTNASLENNFDGCGMAGYESCQIVSYSAWDIPGFGGGIMPLLYGIWSLHNVEGHIKGSWGQYRAGESEEGEIPPDSFCCALGYQALADITCFSVRALPSGDNYILLYCFYVCVELSKISSAIDNYGSTNWATALAARLGFRLTASGLNDVAIKLASNICNIFRFDGKRAEILQSVQNNSATNQSVSDVLKNGFNSINKNDILLSNHDAARQLYFALLQSNPSDSERDNIAQKFNSQSFAEIIKSILEDNASRSSVSFPLHSPTVTCRINKRDAGNNLRTITVNGSGKSTTPFVYNRGTYPANIDCSEQGWHLAANNTVEIPDTGSSQTYYYECNAKAILPTDTPTNFIVNYHRDFNAMSKLGESPLCYTHIGIRGETYYALDKTTTHASRTNCSWDGWYLDPACTVPYEPKVLECDLDLYCINRATVVWRISDRTKTLEESCKYHLFEDPELTLEINPNDYLPSKQVVSWNDAYSLPQYPTLYWLADGFLRSTPGQCCRDAAAKHPISDSVVITGNTTLYADWRPATYDGIRMD